MSDRKIDVIGLDQADTIGAVFKERVARSPDADATIQFNEANDQWEEMTWAETAKQVARWQASLIKEQLQPGDRVAMMLRNCREWAIFDIAAQGLGLVTVPVYTNDRADNIGYILQNSGTRLLLVGDQEQWATVEQITTPLPNLVRIVMLEQLDESQLQTKVVHIDDWLCKEGGEIQVNTTDSQVLASLVYTSGTTGLPKGVMLSHRNMLWNAAAGLQAIDVYTDDLFLSFLPLSHTLERTIGYYLPMVTGSTIAYARSIPLLGDDLQQIKPTILISVPRIFERVYSKIHSKLNDDSPLARMLFNKTVEVGWKRFLHQQKQPGGKNSILLWPILERLVARKVQAKLGGRLSFAISGGAALSPEIAKLFIGLGMTIVQGYGLTEASPVIAVNTLEDNIPASVGPHLPGIEVKIGDNDELLTRSPSVMLGYWDNPEATKATIEPDGWLHTGDKASIIDNHIHITGRLKEIIVLANGEKVPPSDMETAIQLDPLFEQVLVVGESRPYLIALVVLNTELKQKQCAQLDLPEDVSSNDPRLLEYLLLRIGGQLRSFPGYARVRRVGVIDEPWTIENGLITPTLKPRRTRIMKACADEIAQLYEGH